MQKILTSSQLKACDKFTIENEPVASIDLMERACREFVAWFTERFDIGQRIGVVCGTGNNGGDGLGIARLLKGWGYPVTVWIVKGGVKETPDFSRNFARLGDSVRMHEIKSIGDEELFHECDVLIDAIFGSGISRSAEGLYADVIGRINNTECKRVAVDVPSGLLLDLHTAGPCVHADYTITFQFPKLAFLLPENARFVGEWHAVDIHLSKQFIREVETTNYFLTAKAIKKKIKVRSKFDNKGDHGKALLIAGSYGKMGACVLATRAALRAGAGLVSVHAPSLGYSILQTAVPEAMVMVDHDEKIFTDNVPSENFNVIGVGPGIGQDPRTRAALEKIMEANKPMVIDADALNILGSHRGLLKKIPAGSILTPHPKEFERLTEKWTDDFDRLEKQKRFAKDINAVVLLKGAHTSVVTPGGVMYFNSTGNPGMATGGSGDVLTGILTGLLAQGYAAEDAAIIGVFLHGLSGDLAAAQMSQNSLIASDLIEFLPYSFKKILG